MHCRWKSKADAVFPGGGGDAPAVADLRGLDGAGATEAGIVMVPDAGMAMDGGARPMDAAVVAIDTLAPPPSGVGGGRGGDIASSDSPGGCGCRIAGRPSRGTGVVIALLGLALLLRRRRPRL
jgi:MYXO-CTERM domain-containing protein